MDVLRKHNGSIEKREREREIGREREKEPEPFAKYWLKKAKEVSFSPSSQFLGLKTPSQNPSCLFGQLFLLLPTAIFTS